MPSSRPSRLGDGLRAAKTYLNSDSDVKPSSKLLISGYSQGGHVAMATQKVIERDYASEFPPSPPPRPCPARTTWSKIWRRDQHDRPDQRRRDAVPAADADQLSEGLRQHLLGPDRRLPAALRGHRRDAVPDQGDDHPADHRRQAAQRPKTFTKLFGTGGLLTDSFKPGPYLTSNFRKALQTNTLLGWTPNPGGPVRRRERPKTVFFFNTTDAQADFASRGKLYPAPTWKGRRR
ncbi:hypothetical protein Ddc_24584 [Ditylenchus destructor]|nr:hypothetical protein Ddc_24584 [Ditylenchus destructor]